jgi:hypothetical protein
MTLLIEERQTWTSLFGYLRCLYSVLSALASAWLSPKAVDGFRGDLTMIYVTAAITALLFIYLGTALVRPEWF